MIASRNKNIVLSILKIFNDNYETEEVLLVRALEYCINEIETDIIHLSNGLTYCTELKQLQELCFMAMKKNIIIVAAFDNFGSISYPAAFDSVIGVDVSEELKSGYCFLSRKDVNILVPNITRRVRWLNDSYFLSNGTSFNSCIITSMIIDILEENRINFNNVLSVLKKNATFIKKINNNKVNDYSFLPKKAIAFPYNKEIHSLIRFKSMLSFTLVNIYDIKYNRHIDMFPEDIINSKRPTDSKPIKSFDSIDWDGEFDTFILGHIHEIEKITGIDYTDIIINECLNHNKCLISFSKPQNYNIIKDKFTEKKLKYYVPCINKEQIPNVFDGKLRKIGKPVLGVFGTSSQQGKYTVQLALRQFFLNEGYIVGQLGTEPSGRLFGFDEVYPMGYESTIEIKGLDSIATINSMMGNIEDKEPDIIIVGSQSQTIPQHTGNLSLYVLYQYEFIYGTEPDIVILCVNMFDDVNYISRTIHYIESIIEARVIALALFPFDRKEVNGVLTNELVPTTSGNIETSKNLLELMFNLRVFIIQNKMAELGIHCINELTK
jgi:hypothetical protein